MTVETKVAENMTRTSRYTSVLPWSRSVEKNFKEKL